METTAPEVSPPEERLHYMKSPPWGHQVSALRFLFKQFWPLKDWEKRRRSNGIPDGGGALLAMEMGTGKTYLGMAMACHLKHIDTVLIVAPLRVAPVWRAQFERHTQRDDLRIVTLGDDAGTVTRKRDLVEQQRQIAAVAKQRLVVIVNYESLYREPLGQWMLKQTWGLIILDESHRIKSATGRTSKFCDHLSSRSIYRLLMTGTPMPHSPLDIFAQFRFIVPGLLEDHFVKFRLRYAIYGGFQGRQVTGYQNLDVLQEKIAPHTFRVSKDVLDLPPNLSVTYSCDLSAGAMRVYLGLKRDLIAEVEAGTVTAANALVKLLRLQQVTGGYIKTDDGQTVPVDSVNAKAGLLQDTLEDIAADEPVVVFCNFKSDLATVHAVAERLGRGCLELSGSRDDLSAWQQGKAPILAVQIRSGGVGIDLTRARYSIYYSLTFSLGDYEQSLSRVHRPGQTRPVLQIHLTCKGTVDEQIMTALDARQEVVASVLSSLTQGVKPDVSTTPNDHR